VNVKEFIEKFFLRDFKRLIYECGFEYLPFLSIATGIEFLGSCLDSYEWEERRLSQKRFKQAIKELFPENYRRLDNDLWKLRCGFTHQCRPDRKFLLGTKKATARDNLLNLEESDEQNKKGEHMRALILEDFYEDFSNACIRLFQESERNSSIRERLAEEYLFTK